jgi:hypothetical protein
MFLVGPDVWESTMFAPCTPDNVQLHVRDRTLDARAVHLSGHEASVWTAEVAPVGAARLVLAWSDGSRTVLHAAIRSHAPDPRLAHMDVRGVEGGWSAFVAYLGATAAARAD